MSIAEDDVEKPKSIPIDEDFAGLIIPNKIYPSKLSKFKSNFVLNKNASVVDKKKQETQKKPVDERNDNVGLIIPTHNTQSKSKITEYRNGVIIEEL